MGYPEWGERFNRTNSPDFITQIDWPEEDILVRFSFGSGLSFFSTQSWEREFNILFSTENYLLTRPIVYTWSSENTGLIISYGSQGIRDSGALVLYDPNTGAEIKEIGVDALQLFDLTVSNDGSILAGGRDKWSSKIIFFDNKSNYYIGELETDMEIQDLDWSPDDQYLVTGSSTGSVVIWEPISGQLVHEKKIINGAVSDVIWFSPDKIFILYENGST